MEVAGNAVQNDMKAGGFGSNGNDNAAFGSHDGMETDNNRAREASNSSSSSQTTRRVQVEIKLGHRMVRGLFRLLLLMMMLTTVWSLCYLVMRCIISSSNKKPLALMASSSGIMLKTLNQKKWQQLSGRWRNLPLS